MKIKTILAICMFAASSMALASEGSHDCHDKHHSQTGVHVEQAVVASVHDANKKTCNKKGHGAMHKGHDKHQAKAGKGHCKMKHGEHAKDSGKTCHTDDCAGQCEHGPGECKDAKCKEHCKSMHAEHDKHQAESMAGHDMDHAEHMKAMGGTCHDDDCATLCEKGDMHCDDEKCQEYCDDMHEGHSGH